METLAINVLDSEDGEITIQGDVILTGLSTTSALSAESLIVTGYE